MNDNFLVFRYLLYIMHSFQISLNCPNRYAIFLSELFPSLFTFYIICDNLLFITTFPSQKLTSTIFTFILLYLLPLSILDHM